ncbi:MAG TPA: RNB domain-containing ribonuclease [Vicinamibacterales bacterium]|nr:RNB domain-containing ribonuclease [Vicinamibacterales bacterium]
MTTLSSRQLLRQIARQAMRDRGFEPDFPPEALRQVQQPPAPPRPADGVRDLRGLLWASIDNDSSRDLDQLSVAQPLPDGATAMLVAVADVDALVPARSPVDGHAAANTTSVYTAAEVFPMLPPQLSTDRSSLGQGDDRLAIVITLEVADDGHVRASAISRALVRNRAKLAYDSTGAWLEGSGPMPPAVAAVPGLADNLRQQDTTAQAMRQRRHACGALTLETAEARPVFDGEMLRDLAIEHSNAAKDLIEDLMIAANTAIARFLQERGSPAIRRVVREPKRWGRIVAVAAESGTRLPDRPDAKAMETWLMHQRAAAPDRFADLSLTVVKLLGRGEYVVEPPPSGHFGLAVHDYTHATAPNRRFADLVTQRLVKAALADGPPPYDTTALVALAQHCTEREDAANRVERQVGKSAAALLLSRRIGETFDAMVTGVTPQGTWVRLRHPLVEGRLEHDGVDVGDRLKVRLVSTDVPRGYIDFQRVK